VGRADRPGAAARAGALRWTGAVRWTGAMGWTGAARWTGAMGGTGAMSPAGCVTARAGEIARARARVLVPRSGAAVRVVVPRPPVHRNVTAFARSVTPVVVGTVVVRHLCSSPMVGGRKTASPEQ
jgi:hypothetical protein